MDRLENSFARLFVSKKQKEDFPQLAIAEFELDEKDGTISSDWENAISRSAQFALKQSTRKQHGSVRNNGFLEDTELPENFAITVEVDLLAKCS